MTTPPKSLKDIRKAYRDELLSHVRHLRSELKTAEAELAALDLATSPPATRVNTGTRVSPKDNPTNAQILPLVLKAMHTDKREYTPSEELYAVVADAGFPFAGLNPKAAFYKRLIDMAGKPFLYARNNGFKINPEHRGTIVAHAGHGVTVKPDNIGLFDVDQSHAATA